MGYRYIGTKTKILNIIIEKVTQLTPKNGHVVDLMCGTASVSLVLRKNGFQVTAIDIMTYSSHHAKVALLINSSLKFSKAKSFINKFTSSTQYNLFTHSPYEKMIKALNNINPRKGYFWKEFSIAGNPKNSRKPRNYFSPENAKKIDGIRYWIKKLKKDKAINDLEHSLLLHDLIMATNDIANISGTYGHYLSKLTGRANSMIELKPSIFDFQGNFNKNCVLQAYAENIASKIKCDTCYIDPPYMKRQYAANYHILETIAKEDNPEAIGESGLRPWRNQYSNFCTKTKIKNSFRDIFSKMQCANFLISYSEDGLLSLDDMKKLFSEFGKVAVLIFENRRFRSNKSKLTSRLKEYLIHIKNN